MSVTTEPATQVTETPPAMVTVTAADLLTLLDSVAPFVKPRPQDYPGNPTVQSVRLEAGHGLLTATGTNRYVVGHARKKATGSLPPVFVDHEQAAAVSQAIALGVDEEKRRGALVQVTLQASHLGDMVAFTIDRTLSVSVLAISPSGDPTSHLARMFETAPNRETSTMEGPTAIGPDWLDAIVAASRVASRGRIEGETEPIRFYCGKPLGPIRVEVGDWFVGLIMPTKIQHNRESKTAASFDNVPFGLGN